jgi:colicin import membrane protein
MKAVLLFLALAAAALPAVAIDPAAERAERRRIESERSQVEAAFAQRERECRERFVVTSCLEDARRDRRQSLESLRQQQAILDESQRKQRAAQRMDDIRSKVSEADAHRRSATAEPGKERPKREVAARTPHAASAVEEGATGVSRSGTEAARRVSEYERRQAEARAHRAAVERRNAEKAAQGKVSRPLPAPSAPAASAGG